MYPLPVYPPPPLPASLPQGPFASLMIEHWDYLLVSLGEGLLIGTPLSLVGQDLKLEGKTLRHLLKDMAYNLQISCKVCKISTKIIEISSKKKMDYNRL